MRNDSIDFMTSEKLVEILKSKGVHIDYIPVAVLQSEGRVFQERDLRKVLRSLNSEL